MASPRAKKTKAEIERLILDRCGAEGLQVAAVMVWPSEAYGWEASYVSAPSKVIPNLDDFDGIVRALREMYDLKD